MKIPYTFEFKEDPPLLQTLPFWCNYPMQSANRCCHYILEDTEILSQQLNHKPFFIDLIEIKQKKKTRIPFRIHVKGLFLYFMLQGSVAVSSSSHEVLMVTRRNTFQLCMFSPGLYELASAPGNHALLLINIRPKWVQKHLGKLTAVQEIIHQFYATDKPFRSWAKCRTDRRAANWIAKIYNYSQKYLIAINGYLKAYVTLLLDYYNNALSNEKIEFTEEVKQFILENYTDPDLNVQMMADKFNVTRQTLRNHFLSTYGHNIHEYYTSLRRKKAQKLLKTPGVKPVDIFAEVGYRDVRTLRAMLEAQPDNKKSATHLKG